MPFVYDKAQYKTIDAERKLTFSLTNPNQEREATLSLLHEDGSGIVTLAVPRDPSPALDAKINDLQAHYGEAWTVLMPHNDLQRFGRSWYSRSAITALMQEAADAHVTKWVKPDEIALCELIFEFHAES